MTGGGPYWEPGLCRGMAGADQQGVGMTSSTPSPHDSGTPPSESSAAGPADVAAADCAGALGGGLVRGGAAVGGALALLAGGGDEDAGRLVVVADAGIEVVLGLSGGRVAGGGSRGAWAGWRGSWVRGRSRPD